MSASHQLVDDRTVSTSFLNS